MQLLSILSKTTDKSFTKLAYKQYNIKKKKKGDFRLSDFQKHYHWLLIIRVTTFLISWDGGILDTMLHVPLTCDLDIGLL